MYGRDERTVRLAHRGLIVGEFSLLRAVLNCQDRNLFRNFVKVVVELAG